jgi:hypothetical protein
VLGDGEGAGFPGAREHERELLAAEPGRLVTVIARRAQDLGEAPQHVVARVVAERIVDALEVVEVEHQKRELPAGAERVVGMPGVGILGDVERRRVDQHAVAGPVVLAGRHEVGAMAEEAVGEQPAPVIMARGLAHQQCP